MRFGPAIFEAHVRTTVRENYFKWIFQHLTDTDDVEDEDAFNFRMEYDESVINNLPKTLVCTHKETTRFPYEDYELYYGNAGSYPCDRIENDEVPEQIGVDAECIHGARTVNNDDGHESAGGKDDDDNDVEGYCSANTSVGEQSSSSPTSTVTTTTAATTITERSVIQVSSPDDDGLIGKRFFLVRKSDDKKRFKKIRDKQRDALVALIKKKGDEHKNTILALRETVRKIRELKKSKTKEDENKAKESVVVAKRKLRLFKDPGEMESLGPSRKRYRKSLDNQTRYSDSKVSFFSQTNDALKIEENNGIRKSFEFTYKRIWNEVLKAQREPISTEPLPPVTEMSRDLAEDVDQMLMDSIDDYEEV